MSDDTCQKAGRPARPQQAGPRLVQPPGRPPATAPDPDSAFALEDLKRSYREWSVWMGRGPDGQEGRREGMGDEDRCAACGALIEYEVHINPAGGGAADGRRYCSVGCAAAGQEVSEEAEKRAAKEGGGK